MLHLVEGKRSKGKGRENKSLEGRKENSSKFLHVWLQARVGIVEGKILSSIVP